MFVLRSCFRIYGRTEAGLPAVDPGQVGDGDADQLLRPFPAHQLTQGALL